MEQNEMNNMEVTVENDQAAVAEVSEPETGISKNAVGCIVAYVAGVATPFVIKGAVKFGKWVAKKVRDKKAAKTTVVDDEFEEMPDFGDAE